MYHRQDWERHIALAKASGIEPFLIERVLFESGKESAQRQAEQQTMDSRDVHEDERRSFTSSLGDY
jgi:hypothetical protein